MNRLSVIGAALVLAISFTGCQPEPDPKAAPLTVTVPTSIDASGATDVSAPMKAFLASVPDGAQVVFRRGAIYRMERTLEIFGRSNLTIRGNGATFKATTPGDRTRSNLAIRDSSAITVSDLTIIGANPNAGMGDSAYDRAREAQHGIDANSVSGLLLQRITVTDTYGDFVYLGRNEEHPWSSDIVISDSRFARNGRQGVTVTAARNVVIHHNTFDQMRRATFDLEAHHPGFGVDGLVIRDNRIGPGRLALLAAVGTAANNHVVFQRNVVGRPLDIVQSSEDGETLRDWQILDNVGAGSVGNPNQALMKFDHLDGLQVRGNRQTFDTWRPMYGAKVRNSCNVAFSGNTYTGAVADLEAVGSC